jgi:hypothetical protein
VLAIANPSIDSHKEAVEQKLYSQSDISKVTDADLDSFATVGYALADGAIFSVIDSMVEGISRDNYILFSLTKATYEGNSRYIGLGLLGKVFITNKYKLESDAIIDKK